MDTRAILIAIVGPTASGKSALGVRLAELLGGEVVVCDSTQVYRGFDIGTGKPTEAERRGIPHHLMDILEPGELFTAGEYRRLALEVLYRLREARKPSIVTAGTGLYLRALLEGLADAPPRSEELRERLNARAEKHRAGYLHRILRRLDPQAAGRIAARDTAKTIRAIEVTLLAGKPITEVHQAGRTKLEGFRVLRIGLLPPRDELYQRIHQRIEAMLAAGWLEEVRGLIERGIPATAKPFQFIGYGELRAHLEGRASLAEARQAIQQATRRYAKRQITWFRKEPDVRWFAGFGDVPQISTEVEAYLKGQGVAGRKNHTALAQEV